MNNPTADNRQPTVLPPNPGAATVVVLLALVVATASTAATVRLDAGTTVQRLLAVSRAGAASAAQVDAARAAVAAADAAAYPSLAASANVSRRSAVPEFAVGVGGPLEPPIVMYPNIETTYAASLLARQVLYAGGAVEAGRAASRHRLDADEAARRRVDADLARTGRLSYWEAVRAEASLEATAANRERARRLLADTEALREAGMAVDADVLAARSRLASAQVATVRADTRNRDALAQLRSLLQLAADDTVVLADRLGAALPDAPGPRADLQGLAQAHRPELAASSARLAALGEGERLARAPARPSLALAAAWDLARPNQRYFPLTDTWNDSWSVGLSAGWTLFDGGKSRADTRAAQAEQRAAAAERDELARTVALEVEIARQDLLAALSAVDASDAARAAATERERATAERQQAGLATMVEILDAQAELAAAEQQQIDTRAAAWIAAALLDRAVGR